MIRLLHLRLTPRLTLVFVLFAAVLLLFVGVLAYFSGRTGLEEATISTLFSAALEKEAALNEWIQERQSDLATIAASPGLIEHVDALVNPQADTALAQTARDRLVAELQPVTVNASGFLVVFVMDAETGQIIAATDPNLEGTFREDRPFFINGRNGPFIQNPYYSLSLQRPTMALSFPLQARNGTLLGVLAGHLDLNEMNLFVTRRTGLRQTEDAYLVNTANLFVTQPTLLSGPAVLQQGVHTEALKHCLQGNSGVVFAPDYRNKPAIVIYRWLAERQLCLIVKMDQAEALAPVQAFGTALVAIGAVALVAASLLGIALARTLTHPILTLQSGVTRFGQGELTTRLPEGGRDELAILAHEFNQMATSLADKESLLRDYTTQLEQKVEDRTAALRSYAERLAAINRLDRAISSNLNISEVYDTFVTELQALIELDRTAIVRLNETGDQWQVTRQWTRHQPVILPSEWRQVNGSVIEWLVKNAAPLSESEVGERGDWPETKLLRREGIRSRVLLPFIIQKRVVGVLTVESCQPSAFSEEDQRMLVAIADQLAIAIQNADLYQRVQRHAAELEQRVIERTAQLEASNKELEAFSYSVSHDLRSPLRAIDGFSRILLRDYAEQLPDAAKRYLNLVRDNSQQMGTLIDDLLTFSRLNRQPLNKQQVDMVSMVRHVLKELSGEQDKRQVEITIGDLPTCQADPALLKQVFVNLLSNALKFTQQRDRAHIEVNYQKEDEEKVYYIKDNGAGFDMVFANKLFGVFQRLHRADEFPGTGVGLAIVQRIVHRHGGRIWADAEVDKGATFYFSLEGGTPND